MSKMCYSVVYKSIDYNKLKRVAHDNHGLVGALAKVYNLTK